MCHLVAMSRADDRVSNVTAGVLLTAAGLHVAWGAGSSFPFRSTAELTENVVGSPHPPSRSACFSVAVLLGGIAAAVAVRPHLTVIGGCSSSPRPHSGFGPLLGSPGEPTCSCLEAPRRCSGAATVRSSLPSARCCQPECGRRHDARRPRPVSRDEEAGSSCRQRWVGGVRA